MTDDDLKALAAKLMKHYVAEGDEFACKIIETMPLDRGDGLGAAIITPEERTLLNMLGGPKGKELEDRPVGAYEGCGCGDCGDCSDDDDDDSDDGSSEDEKEMMKASKVKSKSK
jgi:hypothetical protein